MANTFLCSRWFALVGIFDVISVARSVCVSHTFWGNCAKDELCMCVDQQWRNTTFTAFQDLWLTDYQGFGDICSCTGDQPNQCPNENVFNIVLWDLDGGNKLSSSDGETCLQLVTVSAAGGQPTTTTGDTPSTEISKTTAGETTSTELSKTTAGDTPSTEISKTTAGETTSTELSKTTAGDTPSTEISKTTAGETTSTELSKTTAGETTSTELSKTTAGETTSTELSKTTAGETTSTELSKTTAGETTSTELSTPTITADDTTSIELHGSTPMTTASETTSMALSTLSEENLSTTLIEQEHTSTDTLTSTSSQRAVSMCPCDCEYLDKIDYWSDEANQLKQYNELSQKLAELKRLLNVETKNLSSFINKKISAADERPSAIVTGYLGALVLGLVFGFIFLLDFPVIIHQIKDLFRNIRGWCDRA
ncbi:uncharacterized protein LOC111099555 isoform X2 [Crassostrea virginica]